MTAVPLSEAELATVQRFEAGQAAEESLRQKVAEALEDACVDNGECSWLNLADAAIAVIRGAESDAVAALRRVEALADFLDRCAEDTEHPNPIVAANVTPERLTLLGRVYRDDARRIRTAIRGASDE